MYRYFIPGLMLMLTACAGNRTAQETAEVIRRGDTVIISNNSPILKQIEFTTVEPETWSAQFRTVGEVTPVAGKIAEISAPFSICPRLLGFLRGGEDVFFRKVQ